MTLEQHNNCTCSLIFGFPCSKYYTMPVGWTPICRTADAKESENHIYWRARIYGVSTEWRVGAPKSYCSVFNCPFPCKANSSLLFFNFLEKIFFKYFRSTAVWIWACETHGCGRSAAFTHGERSLKTDQQRKESLHKCHNKCEKWHLCLNIKYW